MKNAKVMFIGTIDTKGNPLTKLDEEAILDAVSEAVESAGYHLNQTVLLSNELVDNMDKIKNEVELIW